MMRNTKAVLNGEAGLAGIQSAVWGRRAVRMLRQQIVTMLTPDCRVARLQLTRVKYKPRKKLQAYYTIEVVAPHQDQTRVVPFVMTWRGVDGSSSGSEHGAEPATVRQIEDEAACRGLLAPFKRLQSEIEQQQASIQVWPLDPEFTQLPRLGDPGYLQALFESAEISLSGGMVNITPVRYRPGERHVLRYQVETNTQPQIRYAKLYRSSESAARAARITQRAADWLDATLPGFHTVRPLGVSQADSVILYPHAEGLPLSQQLRRSPEWLGCQLRLVGNVLQTLHHGPQALTEELEENTLEKEVRVIRRASEHIQVLLPEAGARILALLDQAQDCYTRQPQEVPTFTHSDFKADHLLVGREGMALIDFDTCALADPALDIGKFLADLDWWYAIRHTPGIEQAQAEFLKGYGLAAKERLSRAQVFHSLILVKIAIRRARLYWKDWESVTLNSIARAEKVLTAAMNI